MKSKSLLSIILLISICEFSFAQLNAVWSKTFSGPGDAQDEPAAMTTDQQGNFYVTAVTSDSGSNVDYIATIKYNSAGNQQWIAYYAGPGGNAVGSENPIDITTDHAGNVYVEGITPENGTNSDYLTIKYNSAGQQVWEASYSTPGFFQDQASELAVDDTGNVYVTGWAGSQGTVQGDFTTVKYDSAGTQQWVRTFSRGIPYDDRATDIAMDQTGNIFVTGWSYSPTAGGPWAITTLKYNAAGVEQWFVSDTFSIRAKSTDLAVDSFGDVFVSGFTYHGVNDSEIDWVVTRYTADGQHSWSHIYNGPANGADYANALATDASGNVYATGVVYDATNYENVLTVKYDSSGNIIWMNAFDGPGHDVDIGYQIFTDANGNVFVTGITESLNFDFDYLILKYSPTGSLLWSHTEDDGIGEDDDPVDAVLDIDNNICMTGSYDGGNSYYDTQTIKFNEVTGIGGLNTMSDFFVFPNPASRQLNFRIDKNISAVKVVDLTGRVQNVLVDFQSSQVNVSDLASGIYFIQLIDAGQKILGTAKFVKQ